MLDSERNTPETANNNEATGQTAGVAPAPTVFNGPTESAVPAVPAALFQLPQVLFQPPAPLAPPPPAAGDQGDARRGRCSARRPGGPPPRGPRATGPPPAASLGAGPTPPPRPRGRAAGRAVG